MSGWATIYHATTYKFLPEGSSRVQKLFYNDKSVGSARCIYNPKDDIFEIRCLAADGPRASKALSKILSRFIAAENELNEDTNYKKKIRLFEASIGDYGDLKDLQNADKPDKPPSLVVRSFPSRDEQGEINLLGFDPPDVVFWRPANEKTKMHTFATSSMLEILEKLCGCCLKLGVTGKSIAISSASPSSVEDVKARLTTIEDAWHRNVLVAHTLRLRQAKGNPFVLSFRQLKDPRQSAQGSLGRLLISPTSSIICAPENQTLSRTLASRFISQYLTKATETDTQQEWVAAPTVNEIMTPRGNVSASESFKNVAFRDIGTAKPSYPAYEEHHKELVLAVESWNASIPAQAAPPETTSVSDDVSALHGPVPAPGRNQSPSVHHPKIAKPALTGNRPRTLHETPKEKATWAQKARYNSQWAIPSDFNNWAGSKSGSPAPGKSAKVSGNTNKDAGPVVPQALQSHSEKPDSSASMARSSRKARKARRTTSQSAGQDLTESDGKTGLSKDETKTGNTEIEEKVEPDDDAFQVVKRRTNRKRAPAPMSATTHKGNKKMGSAPKGHPGSGAGPGKKEKATSKASQDKAATEDASLRLSRAMEKLSLKSGIATTLTGLQNARSFCGIIKVESEIGKVLFKNVDMSQTYIKPHQFLEQAGKLSGFDSVDQCFTNAVTSRVADMDCVLTLAGLKANAEPTVIDSYYDFLCNDEAGRGCHILVDAASESHPGRIRADPILFSSWYLHHPHRFWDGRITVTGHLDGGPNGFNQHVQSFLDCLHVRKVGRLPVIMGQDGQEHLSLVNCQLRTTLQYSMPSPDEAISLKVEQVSDLEISRRPEQLNIFKAAFLETEGAMIEAQHHWHEVSLSLSAPSPLLAENLNLEFGLNAAWRPQDIVSEEILQRLEECTSRFVERMDRIGAANKGPAWEWERKNLERQQKKLNAPDRFW